MLMKRSRMHAGGFDVGSKMISPPSTIPRPIRPKITLPSSIVSHCKAILGKLSPFLQSNTGVLTGTLIGSYLPFFSVSTIKNFSISRQSTNAFSPAKPTIQIASLNAAPAAPATMA
jgi:hypothetical protein